MRYLLDTNVILPYLANEQTGKALLSQLAADGIAISTITLMEVWQGLYQTAAPLTATERYQAFFDAVVILPFDEPVARRCAKLRYDLQRQGARIRPRALDLMIAATALEHGLVLVTRNTGDYHDVPQLVLYQGQW